MKIKKNLDVFARCLLILEVHLPVAETVEYMRKKSTQNYKVLIFIFLFPKPSKN